MLTKLYKVPNEAYPNYENAINKYFGFNQGVHKTLKQFGLEEEIDNLKLPQMRNPTVIVACHSRTKIKVTDVVDIKTNAKYERAKHKHYPDVKSILTELNEKRSTVVVVVLNGIPTAEEKALYKKYRHKVILVANNDEMRNILHFKTTQKDWIGIEVGQKLVINLIRNCHQRALRHIISTGTTDMAKNIYRRVMIVFCSMLNICVAPIVTETEENQRCKTAESRVRGILIEDTDSVGIYNDEDNDVIYSVLKIWSNQILNDIKTCLKIEGDSVATAVRRPFKYILEREAETANLLFGLLKSTVDTDTRLVDKDCPSDMLSVLLIQRSKVIKRGLYKIISELKIVEILDHHTERLLRVVELRKYSASPSIAERETDQTNPKTAISESCVTGLLLQDLDPLPQKVNVETREEAATQNVNELGAKPKKIQSISHNSELEGDNTTPKELFENNTESIIATGSVNKGHIQHSESVRASDEERFSVLEKRNDTTATFNETPPPGLPSKLAVLAANGEIVHVTTQPEADLPQQWPNEEVMRAPIEVKSCDRKFVRDNWLDPKVYSLKKGRRGNFLIISNKTFTGPIEIDQNGVSKVALATRHGTERDVQGLKELFTQLYYDVVIHEDLTAAEINKVVLQESLNRTSKDESFVSCISSHGNNKGIYGTDGEIVQVDDITACFDGQNCPALVDKPKLFLIQACRGEESDNPAPIQHVNGIANSPMSNTLDALPTAPSNETPLLMPDTSIPTTADTLIACATHQGYVSFRNEMYGSWFLQAVIHVFSRYAWKESVSDRLIYVNELVARGRTPDADGGRPLRQAAVSQNSFRRKLYFFPGIVEPNGTIS